jgi:hypothetical protein
MKATIDDTNAIIDYLMYQYRGANPELTKVVVKEIDNDLDRVWITIQLKTSSRTVGENTYLLSANDLIDFKWLSLNDFEEKFIDVEF